VGHLTGKGCASKPPPSSAAVNLPKTLNSRMVVGPCDGVGGSPDLRSRHQVDGTCRDLTGKYLCQRSLGGCWGRPAELQTEMHALDLD
jgi:hypothetical protein